ncbi:MAG: hypothetical protein L6W00_04005 [Lentisphaeria bacterium]|nr:MAG: hypothetical protein L6W00_04005 [Lentisphaeria bacterium]
MFQITIGDFIWCGKAPSGNYPNWKQVIPADNALDYSITFHEPKQVIDFLKTVPDHEPYHGIELNVTPEGVSVIPLDYPICAWKRLPIMPECDPVPYWFSTSTSCFGCWHRDIVRSGQTRTD